MKRILEILLATVMVMLCLTGCAKKTEASTTTATTESPSVETIANVAASTEEVAESSVLTDNSINIGYGTAIDSLTPFRSNTAKNAPYMMQLYETLGVLNDENEVVPYAAKSWTTDDNGFTYDVEIYSYITDSNGNNITASDVVWFINESKARGLKPTFSKVESATVTGDYTLEIKMNSNIVGAFEGLLIDTFVVSEKAFKESSDEFGLSAVSTSPYKVTSFTPSAQLNFERRDDYWQDIELLPECVRPLQKYVNYSIITEAFQLGVALETGTVDAVIDIAASTGSQYVGNTSYTIDLSDGPQGWQVFFSGAESSLLAKSKELRQAICYAIDENGMIQAIASGYGTQMWDCASPRLIGFNEKWKNEDYYQYDVEKAKELVEASGYNGEELVLLSTSSATASRLGQLIQGFCRQVGINVKINAVDMALYTAIRLDGTQYDMTINTVGGTALPDFWSIRFDPAAYTNGDATGRNDMVLADLIYKAWTVDGFTEENIDAVHYYIKDNAIAYGIVNPSVFTIWNNNINMKKIVRGGMSGYVSFASCQLGD